MSTNRSIGGAPTIAQSDTITIGSSTSAQTFSVTINSKTITYTAGVTETTATIAAALQALLAACQEPEFLEVGWTYPGTGAVITATANTPGMPFTETVGGTGTITLANVTPSSGPNHVDKTANWSLGTLPGATDDVLIDGGPDLLWGFNNLSAAAYNSFRVKGTFDGGKIGLPRWNTGNGGGTGYLEYRGREWPMNTAVPVTVGEGDGNGPQRLNITSGAVLNATILKTSQRDQTDNVPVVNISGCTSGTLVIAGTTDVGLAADDDTLSGTVTTATVGGDATLTVGKGGTATTVNQDGGEVLNRGTVGTLNAVDGTFTHQGVISTAVNADPGPFLFDWQAGGTIPTATFKGQGPGQNAPQLECANDPRAKTLTNGTFTGGAVFHDPNKSVTMSNPISTDRATVLASDFGARYTMTRT